MPIQREFVHSLRHRGIKVTIWKHCSGTCHSYDITLCRSVRSHGRWVESSDFGLDDLINISALMYRVHRYISSRSIDSNDDPSMNVEMTCNAFN